MDIRNIYKNSGDDIYTISFNPEYEHKIEKSSFSVNTGIELNYKRYYHFQLEYGVKGTFEPRYYYNLKKRINFFQSLNICLNNGGDLILVVPSLESKLYTNIIAHRWNVDDDHKEKIESVEKAYAMAKNIKQGVTDIDNVPTKHYLKEELELLLTLEGFVVDRIEKINYTWKTEFNNPPKWLAEPSPWDWMCVAKKD